MCFSPLRRILIEKAFTHPLLGGKIKKKERDTKEELKPKWISLRRETFRRGGRFRNVKSGKISRQKYLNR